MVTKISMCCRILIAAFALVVGVNLALADPPSVTAVLSKSDTVVGETVELQIKVTGPGDARPPEEISIDGLEIHSTGTSRQFEIHNFSTSSSVTYNYTILPLRAGRFTIPPQTVRAGAQVLRTPELALNVADGAGQPNTGRSGRAAQRQATTTGDLVFAELIVPKKPLTWARSFLFRSGWDLMRAFIPDLSSRLKSRGKDLPLRNYSNHHKIWRRLMESLST
jgi:hypothetical protein